MYISDNSLCGSEETEIWVLHTVGHQKVEHFGIGSEINFRLDRI